MRQWHNSNCGSVRGRWNFDELSEKITENMKCFMLLIGNINLNDVKTLHQFELMARIIDALHYHQDSDNYAFAWCIFSYFHILTEYKLLIQTVCIFFTT